MASHFNVELSVPEPPAEAQARAADALDEPARLVGLRLTKRGAGELQYRPRVQFPFLLMLWHNLNGERMTVKFEPGETGGTRVIISGAVARGHHALAADSEHWSEALGGSTPAAVGRLDCPKKTRGGHPLRGVARVSGTPAPPGLQSAASAPLGTEPSTTPRREHRGSHVSYRRASSKRRRPGSGAS